MELQENESLTPKVISPLPEPRMKGRFNLYDTPEGGIHISYLVDDTEETQHIDIPAQAVQLSKMIEANGGSMNPKTLMKMFTGMFGK